MSENVKEKELGTALCVFPNKGGKNLFEEGAAEE